MATQLSNQQGTCSQLTDKYSVYGRVWLDSQDARNCQSKIRVQLVNRTNNTNYSWESNYKSGAFIRLDWTSYDMTGASGSCYSWDSNKEYVMFEKSFTIDHNTTTGQKTINLWVHCIANGGGWGPGTCYVKSSGYAWDVTIPTIDRAAPTVTNTVKSVTTNSAVITWGANTSCDSLQYKIGNGSWTGVSGYPDYTITGLSANTTYTIYTRARKESNWVWGSASGITVQTHPNTVGCNTPSASASDPFTISVSVTSKDQSNTSKIRVYCGSTYKDITGGSGTVTFTGLTPETQYKIYGRAYTVRSGATSDSGAVYVTTPADSFCYVINENGTKTGKHKMYLIDTNGTKTEVKKGNVKVL